MRRLPFALQNPAAALDSERRERVRVSPAGRRAANDRRRRAARRRCYFESHPQHSQGLRSALRLPSKEGCGCWPTRGSFGWLLLLRICITE